VKIETKSTHISYFQDPIPELTANGHDTWSLCIEIPIPSDVINPTLTDLDYIVKYATTNDKGDATVQADVAITSTRCPVGVVLETSDLVIYSQDKKAAYSPRVIDEELALCLSTAHAVKCNAGNAQWSHHVDHRHVGSHVRLVGVSYLYFYFHVVEYPSADSSRSIAVEVSATWTEDLEARRLKDAADKKAKEEAEKKAKEEAERKAREEAERKAREEAERKAQEEAARKAQEEAAKKKEEKPSVKEAPPVADAQMQELIQETAKKHGAECPQGFAWHKTDYGYVCGGGGHKLTFAQLGMA